MRGKDAQDVRGKFVMPDNDLDALLFSVLPAGARRIRVAGPRSGKPGETIRFEATIEVAGSPLADSLLRVDLLAPDGKYVPAYRRFVKTTEKPSPYTLPIALNEPPGSYTLRVVELVSGSVASWPIVVER